MLFFQSQFLPLIRSGAKTQTIRLWSRPRVKLGQRAYVPGLHPDAEKSRLLITAIDPIPSLRSLTKKDARADGFPTLRALRAELRRLYPQPRAAKRQLHLYRIRFQYPVPSPASSRRQPGTPRKLTTATPPHKPPLTATPSQQRRQLARYLRALAPIPDSTH